jgi:hypothetical protein
VLGLLLLRLARVSRDRLRLWVFPVEPQDNEDPGIPTYRPTRAKDLFSYEDGPTPADDLLTDAHDPPLVEDLPGYENRPVPGAWVAAGGGKWAAPVMVAVNMQVRMLHAPYVRSFEGFDRPWNLLEQLIEGVHVREMVFGSGYIVTGRAPPRPSA